jgi:hypothetical protein
VVDRLGNIEHTPSYSVDLRAIAEALDEAGAPRKIGTLSLNLVERVDLLARQLQGAVEALRRYGDHDRSCAVRFGHPACTCGFAAAAGKPTTLGGQ